MKYTLQAEVIQIYSLFICSFSEPINYIPALIYRAQNISWAHDHVRPIDYRAIHLTIVIQQMKHKILCKFINMNNLSFLYCGCLLPKFLNFLKRSSLVH